MIPSLRALALLFAVPLSCAALPVGAAVDAGEPWQPVLTSDGSAPTPRHESGAVVVGGKLYLLGGRGIRPLEVFDPIARTWRDLGALPGELHHFQPVAIGSRIYIVGAMRCCYPDEPIERTVHVYDTDTGLWSTAGSLPAARARGAAGTVVRGGRIYLVGGNTRGHGDGSVGWFDLFDPLSGQWQVLPDMPHPRDHAHAVLVGDTLVAAAGRRTDQPNPFDRPVLPTDRYDFATGAWSVGADIPTARAGAVTVAAGGEVIVAGGEINTSSDALATVEAYSPVSDSWRTLAPLNRGRHSGGGAVLGDDLHVIAGNSATGGGAETAAHERLALGAGGQVDSDGDGLTDAEERGVWTTDPALADTDGDGLDDGDEVGRGTDPLRGDSDEDGLSDGEEVAPIGTDPLAFDTDADELGDGDELDVHGTEPRLVDTDGDRLEDGAEVLRHGTDPLAADTDGDGLDDGAEIATHATEPRIADTDGDGLDDGAEVEVHGTSPRQADTDGDGVLDGAEIERGTDPLRREAGTGEPDPGPEPPPGPNPGPDPEPPAGEERPDGQGGSGSSGGGGAAWLLVALIGVMRMTRRAR